MLDLEYLFLRAAPFLSTDEAKVFHEINITHYSYHLHPACNLNKILSSYVHVASLQGQWATGVLNPENQKLCTAR